MTLEDKCLELCQKMVDDGKLPGTIYMNNKTLNKMAQEFEPGERVVVPLDYSGNVGMEVKNQIEPEGCGVVFFKVDNTLADGEIIVKSRLEENGFEEVKK